MKTLKFVSAIFYQIFVFYQMPALQKQWKMFFTSSKKLFSFSRYSNFCIFVFSFFYPIRYCSRVWSKKIIKVYGVINCLNMNLEHVYMRPEVNSNQFDISLRCEVTSLSAFIWLRAQWNSLRCKFHFGHFDRSEILNRSEFSM